MTLNVHHVQRERIQMLITLHCTCLTIWKLFIEHGGYISENVNIFVFFIPMFVPTV